MTYSVLDRETGNVLAEFDHQIDALEAVREFLLGSPWATDDLALLAVDDDGRVSPIFVGMQLTLRALTGGRQMRVIQGQEFRPDSALVGSNLVLTEFKGSLPYQRLRAHSKVLTAGPGPEITTYEVKAASLHNRGRSVGIGAKTIKVLSEWK